MSENKYTEPVNVPKVLDALERLGNTVMRIKEDESNLQRVIGEVGQYERQRFFPVDTSIWKVTSDPLIPNNYFENTKAFQDQSLELLKSINQNTANLYAVVELIRSSNEHQETVIELMGEILSIAKAKSKEEADSTYRKIMNKITTAIGDAETLAKVVGYATTVYSVVSTYYPQIAK